MAQSELQWSELVDRRLASEQGTLYGQGSRGYALVYPSPYAVGMSSLGFQAIYRGLNELHDTYAERAFLPDDETTTQGPLLTYESGRPASDFSVVAFSVAYELELTGVFRCLEMMGVSPLRGERKSSDPWVVAGGPLTFSNPVPLAPFVDIIVMGEAEELLAELNDILFEYDRPEALRRLSERPGFFVPAHHGEWLPAVAKASDSVPAFGCLVSPEAALRDMFLIEVERGCSRACSFCVMRRSTNGGMRIAKVEDIISKIPDDVTRVGLVGAAVSDHPKIVDIVRQIVDSGKEVGLSSLRADRLTPEFVEALVDGGYRTLTIASDGPSERLRGLLLKKIRSKHLLKAAELAKEGGVSQLKVYMMVGVPDETDADLDELVEFSLEQRAICTPSTRVSLGIAPFVAKRNTPLDETPFAGIKEVEHKLQRIRKGLKGRVEVRPTSARWAWVEYQLAQGGSEAGLAYYRAYLAGGKFSHLRRAFESIAPKPKAPRLTVLS